MNAPLQRSGSLGGSLIAQGSASPERTVKIREWLATKITALLPTFFDGVSKLERAYHLPLSRKLEAVESLEQVVASLQVVAAALCRILYFLTSSKLADLADVFTRLEFFSDWDDVKQSNDVDIDIYLVLEPSVAATARIEQTLEKINLHTLATAENIQQSPLPTTTKDLLNLSVTRVIKAARFFDIMVFGLLMRKLDFSMLKHAGVITTLKQVKQMNDEGKLSEEDYFTMRMSILDPFIPKASSYSPNNMERPTANARSAATLRMRPGRYSTIGIPSALGEDGPSPSDFPSGFEKTPKPNQQSVRGVSFCASPRAPSEKPAEQLTEKEKIADAVSQIALTVPQRRESLSGIASPRRTEASASTPPPTSEKKAPVIPPKPRIDWTTRGPPPPGSLGPKIPRPEDVNPDLRARNKAATELKSTIGMTAIDIQGTIRAHNAKMFEDLENAHISRKKQDEQLELEIYMRRQKLWEDQRKLEKEKERTKAQETIRKGNWKTTGMSAQDVYALQKEIAREENEKEEKERAKTEAEMQRRTTAGTMRASSTSKSEKNSDALSQSRQVNSKKK